jgi:hypothetical protein
MLRAEPVADGRLAFGQGIEIAHVGANMARQSQTAKAGETLGLPTGVLAPDAASHEDPLDLIEGHFLREARRNQRPTADACNRLDVGLSSFRPYP